jgi:hypothetical protein
MLGGVNKLENSIQMYSQITELSRFYRACEFSVIIKIQFFVISF